MRKWNIVREGVGKICDLYIRYDKKKLPGDPRKKENEAKPIFFSTVNGCCLAVKVGLLFLRI